MYECFYRFVDVGGYIDTIDRLGALAINDNLREVKILYPFFIACVTLSMCVGGEFNGFSIRAFPMKK
jgi:hypothetical protein